MADVGSRKLRRTSHIPTDDPASRISKRERKGRTPRPIRYPLFDDSLGITRAVRMALPKPEKESGVDLDDLVHTAVLTARSQQLLDANMAKFVAELARGENGSAKLMQALGKVWAENYDEHMIDHEKAIKGLLRQLVALARMKFGNYSEPIIGKRILEMSCGTGMVIKALCTEMAPGEKVGISVTANDISPDMQNIARKKLENVCKVEYTDKDIRTMRFDNQEFDTIIWSQTLHLVVDPEEFAHEMDTMVGTENTDHEHMKLDVIKRAFDLLSDKRYFILIDEWPPLFTTRSTDPLETVVHPLFNQTFRPVMERATLRDKMMRMVKKTKGARLIAECKARINREHSMYMFIYVKDKDAVEGSRALPRTENEAKALGMDIGEINHLRTRAKLRVIEGFRALDGPFRQGYTPINGETKMWTKFIPVASGELFDSREHDLNGIEFALKDRSGCDTVILADVLHRLNTGRRLDVMMKAIDSLKVGGSLLIMDEWPYSRDKSIDENPVHKSDLRDLMAEHFVKRLVFEATLRERIREGFDSGIYGFLYRKKR